MVNSLSTASPRTNTWTDLVRAGRELAAALSKNKWELGDLTLEVVRMEREATAGAEQRLAEFADRIGVPFNTLREYRSVAAAWPSARRLASAPWSVHQALRRLDDRFELIGSRKWTVREARALAAERRAEERAPDAPHGVEIPAHGVDAWLSAPWSSIDAILRELVTDRELRRALRLRLLRAFGESS